MALQSITTKLAFITNIRSIQSISQLTGCQLSSRHITEDSTDKKSSNLRPLFKPLLEELSKDEDFNAGLFHPKSMLYKKRANQNFEPIPIDQSESLEGETTLNYQSRKGQTFGGMEFMKLPEVKIKAAWNNTFVTITHDQKFYARITSGKIGFKNAKKKTDFAGEETGREAAVKALERGCFDHVRVSVRGIGPGRRSAIRGLNLGGMVVVSISDESPIFEGNLPQRPRKIRRL